MCLNGLGVASDVFLQIAVGLHSYDNAIGLHDMQKFI